MKGIRPCPKCKNEVEVTRMQDKDGEKTYRICCKRCGYLVTRGKKFPEETDEQGEERIRQYEEYMKDQLYGEREQILKVGLK